MQGSLGGLAEAAAGEHEIVAFAPTSIHGPQRIRAALGGIDVEVRTWPLPFSHAVRTAWSGLGHPAAERLLGAFDVLHFSDWMYPPQRSGVRATTIHDLVPLHHPEWTTARTRSMHGRKYRNAATTCDVVFVNSAYTGRDVTATLGVPSERIRVAHPAPKDVFHAGRAGRRSRRPVRPHGRDARAAQESAGARRGASAARRRAAAGRRRRRGLGRAAAARRSRHPPARLRLGRGARAPLPRRDRRRLPVALRGLRHSGDRGDGVRRSRRRLVPRVARRGERRVLPSAPIRRSPLRFAAAIEQAIADREPPGRVRARARHDRSPGARSVRRSCAATRRRAR